ncbi:dTDP-4-dehydrorhamnose reductase [Hyphomonas sp. CACIAM 19H1]|uniref:dTDP-4-dehydrorhamnose reductase n=1 Tax=Hyphomonas sp. CACIAM 19H1 TaxID=1873716 RepID=UPI000DEDB431|nr:dTDP-4-dehydrorhamnose reductase [Hyphomonas sp. CACIAM 19H1]AXE63395.1 dTDP-4-dehydrorhamnose reductase [Hyphomonas sp. CACIAM 19H1]
MSRLNVLVAGRGGQVARALAASVPADRVQAVCLGRPELDIRDTGSIARVVEATAPDLVINAAAYTAVDQAESEPEEAKLVNAAAAGALAEAAAARGAPILHLSTDYVFNGEKSGPYLETDAVNPLGVYGQSKLEGEQKVAQSNPQAIILRTAWVYSPWGKNFAKTMLRVAEGRDELTVVHDQRGNPTSANDIAAALWAIALQYAGNPAALVPGVFHMTAAGEASWAEFAEEIFAVSSAAGGPSARVQRITTAEYPTPTRRPANSRLDCSHLAAIYGVALPDWRSSTRSVVEELVRTKGWSA